MSEQRRLIVQRTEYWDVEYAVEDAVGNVETAAASVQTWQDKYADWTIRNVHYVFEGLVARMQGRKSRWLVRFTAERETWA